VCVVGGCAISIVHDRRAVVDVGHVLTRVGLADWRSVVNFAAKGVDGRRKSVGDDGKRVLVVVVLGQSAGRMNDAR
jgi:hypothetical protein